MKKKDMILVVVLCLALLGVSLLYESKTQITGHVVSDAVPAQAGNVTNLDLARKAGFWQACFGEITVDTSVTTRPSTIAVGGNVCELNLTLPCVSDEIYASISSDVSLIDVLEGKKEAVDTFLSLDSTHPESGSQVFTNLTSFTVNSSVISNVPTTYTQVANSPGNTTFDLGVLNKSDTLIFVSHVSLDTKGFDGKTHDYQIMVPVNQSQITYYFFSDCEAAVAVPPTPTPSPEKPAAKAGKSFFPPEEKEAAPAPIHVPGNYFDVTVKIPEKYRKLLLGEMIIGEVEIIGIRNIGPVNVQIEYLIQDLEGKIFLQGFERRAIENHITFIKEIDLPEDIPAGDYMLIVKVNYEDDIALAGHPFEIIGVKEKRPLFGAAIGLVVGYGKYLAYFIIAIVLLFLLYLLFRYLCSKTCRQNTYHTCTIEELYHHHEEGETVAVNGKIRPKGKSDEGIFSELSDKTGHIDVLTNELVRGRVKVYGIIQRDVDGVIQRDVEQHKYIKAQQITTLFLKPSRKRKRKQKRMRRQETYHACTIEEIFHHHQEEENVVVNGKIRPKGKSKKGLFSELSDKTGHIDVLTSELMRGRVKIYGVIRSDVEQHKYIEAERITPLFLKPSKKRRRKQSKKSKRINILAHHKSRLKSARKKIK